MTQTMKQQLEPEFESAIYKGSVRHRRFTPKQHGFEYPLFMLLLKADEIPRLLRSFWQLGSGPLRWARFRRKDYLGDPEQDLSSAVKTKIAEILGTSTTAVDGDVYLLGQLRYFGLYFSPLNLYYLKQADGFRYMLAEVSNTPWNERHYYLIDLHDTQPHPKAFHVSPFNPMQQTYQWHITPPLAETGKCMVNIQVSDRTESGHKIFDATLTLRRIPLNQTELSRVLLRTPIQTLSIVAGIYWQALRLFFKRAPLYKHPGKAKTETGRGTI